MKPTDDDPKRYLILEQWWSGLVCLLVWAAAILVFVKSCS